MAKDGARGEPGPPLVYVKLRDADLGLDLSRLDDRATGKQRVDAIAVEIQATVPGIIVQVDLALGPREASSLSSSRDGWRGRDRRDAVLTNVRAALRDRHGIIVACDDRLAVAELMAEGHDERQLSLL